MKKIYKAVLPLIFIAAFFAVEASAQNEKFRKEEEVIAFDAKSYDFGDVLSTDGALVHDFVFTNVSSEPLVIHNVVSSCGCTVPEWPNAPIAAGAKGKITVTFKNDQGPYPFNKTVTVYVSNVSRPILLKIKGDVHTKQLPIEELYKTVAGPVAFRQKEYTLGYVHQGKSKSEETDMANLSDKPVNVSFDTPAGLSLSVSPNPVPARGTARVKFTVNTTKGEKNWGKTRYNAVVKADGKPVDLTMGFGAMVTDNFDGYTHSQLQKAPEIVLQQSYHQFGTVKRGKKVTASIKVSNKGKSDLLIYKIDSEKSGVTFSNTFPFSVKPGGEGVISLSFDTSAYSGEPVNVLNLITNCPSKPTVNYFINGIIEK